MNFALTISILQFIGALALLIIIHEIGHFVAARLLGVEIEEFGIGFPPRLIKLFEAGGTIFSLNWLLLGGFVRPKGENNPNVEGGLAAASPWVRLTVLFAGPVMNLLAGVILYAVIVGRVGLPGSGPVKIVEVAPNSPAEAAGLQPDDLILAVDDVEIDGSGTLQQTIYASLDQEISLTYQRGTAVDSVALVPRSDPPPNEGAIGILMTNPNPTRRVPPWEALGLGSVAVVEQSRAILTLPARLLEGSIAPDEARLVGYKGMFDIYQELRDVETPEGAPTGIGTLFFFASITVSLGLLNLLPIPALDGGRILFTLPEIFLRRRIPPNYEALINMVGLAMLLLLMLYINIQDFVNPAQFR